ncbi:MAG TPA: hypothetical protein VGP55_05830 [Chitinophagaceae bacterium]|nr:hypothetical protein [Chitinophagaceae bacterium]
MRKYYLISVLAILTITSAAQKKIENKNPVFDSSLAKKLGADDYGMKKYVMAFLREGKNKNLDSVESANLQISHLKNIIRLADEGKLIVAGPFLDDQPVRGILIFNVSSIEEAKNSLRQIPPLEQVYWKWT